jgi:ParB family transcriptional regulator, chromosome partitioning protein
VAKQKFGLGRGLDALIAGASEVIAAHQPSRIDEHSILQVDIEAIIPNPRQPRRPLTEDDPKLLELSASIREYGLLQPLVVTRLNTNYATPGSSPKEAATDPWFATENQPVEAASEPGEAGVVQFQLIAGERRWRAARLAGLTQVPVIVKEATPQEMIELALIENIQRADLNPIEEALAYQTLIQEFGLTQEMVAKAVGKDRTTITNALRLLTLVPKVREALINQPEHFSEGHARALVGIAREEDQIAAMGKIIALKLNVRQAEELAARIKAAERAAAMQGVIASPPRRSPEVEDLETQFRNALMVKVDLKRNTKGKGTLVLHFNNQEELERLYNRLVKHEE